MAFIVFTVIVIFLAATWFAVRRREKPTYSTRGPARHPGSSTRGSSGGVASPATSAPESRPDPVARGPSQRKAKIVFTDISPNGLHFRPVGSSTDDLSGLCDALTGERLDLPRGIVRCSKCQACYHVASFEFLREQNNGQCASCRSADIRPVALDSAKSLRGWRDFRPDIVTLQDYRGQVGRVVTFEGHVLDIKLSKSGTGFAAMFEPGSWTEGLKLIFPSRYVERVGGRDFILSMRNRTVRVRGLLVSHQIFGDQIIVTERSMIIRIS
jgi:hypothetical protein